ncbi:MAG TPA: hypothetical protein VGO45_00845 [Bacteroidia bacterium]|jgi:tetratricopeptide (TPR) repeat protein|nr:hypothetical protein [Bacteroidia bacterium]
MKLQAAVLLIILIRFTVSGQENKTSPSCVDVSNAVISPGIILTADDEAGQIALYGKYKSIVKRADSLYNTHRHWDLAKKAYEEALVLKPDELYPQDKLKDIIWNHYETLDTVKYAAMLSCPARYPMQIRADSLFDSQNYALAKEEYKEAFYFKPWDRYTSERIRLCNQYLDIAEDTGLVTTFFEYYSSRFQVLSPFPLKELKLIVTDSKGKKVYESTNFDSQNSTGFDPQALPDGDYETILTCKTMYRGKFSKHKRVSGLYKKQHSGG